MLPLALKKMMKKRKSSEKPYVFIITIIIFSRVFFCCMCRFDGGSPSLLTSSLAPPGHHHHHPNLLFCSVPPLPLLHSQCMLHTENTHSTYTRINSNTKRNIPTYIPIRSYRTAYILHTLTKNRKEVKSEEEIWTEKEKEVEAVWMRVAATAAAAAAVVEKRKKKHKKTI